MLGQEPQPLLLSPEGRWGGAGTTSNWKFTADACILEKTKVLLGEARMWPSPSR